MEQTQRENNDELPKVKSIKIEKKIAKQKAKKEIEQQEQNQECAICYGQIEDKGQIVGCEHSYCFECIKYWANMRQICPICRKQFQVIKRQWIVKNKKRSKNYSFRRAYFSNLILSQENPTNFQPFIPFLQFGIRDGSIFQTQLAPQFDDYLGM